ncbi:MAG TPA: hypothetical protein VFS67_34235 [Polyangiaceae bacterium]|nr:hypothetical protein [Polyangiaceae bacterium]
MNRMNYRREAPRRARCWAACLLASWALACSDSKDNDTQTTTNGQQPDATETNVTQPSMLPDNPTTPSTGDDAALCGSALFCDGFENFPAAAPPLAPWTAVQTNGTVVVDTSRAFRGGQSIKATTLSTEQTGQTYKRALIGLGAGSPVIPVPNNAFYGRMMFYLESAPEASLHWTFIDGTGPVPGAGYSSTYRYGGQLPVLEGTTFKGNQLMANYDTLQFYATPPVGPNTDCYKHADAKVVPVGKWSCAEWYFDGTNNQMKFWLDGTEITAIDIDQTGTGCTGADARDVQGYTWAGPTFAQIDLGWESYAADAERTIWIDDVVISQQQVGCPAPGAPAASSSNSNASAGY